MNKNKNKLPNNKKETQQILAMSMKTRINEKKNNKMSMKINKQNKTKCR